MGRRHIPKLMAAGKKKGKKTNPVTCRGGCETSRLPHFQDNRLTIGGEIVSLMRRPPFVPPGRFLVLFLLEVESTPVPSCNGRLGNVNTTKTKQNGHYCVSIPFIIS
jgi:hypothetical protein